VQAWPQRARADFLFVGRGPPHGHEVVRVHLGQGDAAARQRRQTRRDGRPPRPGQAQRRDVRHDQARARRRGERGDRLARVAAQQEKGNARVAQAGRHAPQAAQHEAKLAGARAQEGGDQVEGDGDGRTRGGSLFWGVFCVWVGVRGWMERKRTRVQRKTNAQKPRSSHPLRRVQQGPIVRHALVPGHPVDHGPPGGRHRRRVEAGQGAGRRADAREVDGGLDGFAGGGRRRWRGRATASPTSTSTAATAFLRLGAGGPAARGRGRAPLFAGAGHRAARGEDRRGVPRAPAGEEVDGCGAGCAGRHAQDQGGQRGKGGEGWEGGAPSFFLCKQLAAAATALWQTRNAERAGRKKKKRKKEGG
jgi:hypothetical protein